MTKNEFFRSITVENCQKRLNFDEKKAKKNRILAVWRNAQQKIQKYQINSIKKPILRGACAPRPRGSTPAGFGGCRGRACRVRGRGWAQKCRGPPDGVGVSRGRAER